jgi:hypothetical protein
MVLDDQAAEEDEESPLVTTAGIVPARIASPLPQYDPRARQGIGPLHLSHFLRMILQDAQTRLFFKAQTLVQSEIRYFVPKDNDLAYPDKLTGEQQRRSHPAGDFGLNPRSGVVPTKADSKELELIRRLFASPVVNTADTWYPPLRKALWLLAQLHDFANVRPCSDPASNSTNSPPRCSLPFSRILRKKL